MHVVQQTPRMSRVVATLIVMLCLAISQQRAAAAEQAGVSDILSRVRQHEFHPVRRGMTHDRQLQKAGIADLDNDDWHVRTISVRDLVRLGEDAVPDLVTHLSDDDRHVRYIAAMVLGILADPRGDAPLRAVLQDDDEWLTRSQAVVSLGRIGRESSLDVLRTALADDPSRDVRHQCELAIHRIENAVAARPDLAKAYAALDEKSFETLTVDSPASDFELSDTLGRKWRLSELKGEKTVVLVWIFADWCPVCHSEFRDLLELQEKFAAHDVQLFTIECHDEYRCRVMVGEELEPSYWFTQLSPQAIYAERLWWPHLVDLAGGVAASYGVDPLSFAVHSEYINRPSTVIIDKEGIVRFAYHGTYWGDRPTIDQTLEMIVSGEYDFEHPQRLRP
jgi:peroxiredoxin